jgi:hypothetical protein
MYHISFNHSFLYGHVGSFHSLAIVNSDTINISVQESLLYADLHSFRYIFRSDITGSLNISYILCIFSLLMNLHTDFIVTATIHFPTNIIYWFDLSPYPCILKSIWYCLFSWGQPFWLGWDGITVLFYLHFVYS